MKGCKENVETNVTVTKNIRKCDFSLACRNRNSGGLWEQQQWNSNRFLLKFHFFKLDDNSAFRTRGRRGIQRSVWTGLRGSIRHGQQRVHVGLHIDDIRGSEGDRRRGVLYDIPERDDLDLSECHYKWRKRPRTWDGQHDQRNDHPGHAGHRATDWQRRICDFLGGRSDPLPARYTDHVK